MRWRAVRWGVLLAVLAGVLAACGKPAVATLTYVYADSTAVLGPLATYAEPHCYDLCVAHSERLTAPRGWEVLRLAPDPADLGPTTDDLEALAREGRAVGNPVEPLVRALREHVPEAHVGATSQDILDTAVMLVARGARALIAAEVDWLATACARLADEHRARRLQRH